MVDYIEKVVCEAYAVHYIMSSAGVDMADIFVGPQMIVNASPPGVYCVVMAQQGDKRFVFWTLPLPTRLHQEAFVAAWSKFSAVQPSMPRDKLDAMVDGSEAYKWNKVPILSGLWAKGIGTGPAVMAQEGLN
jgi:hypothetical protein